MIESNSIYGSNKQAFLIWLKPGNFLHFWLTSTILSAYYSYWLWYLYSLSHRLHNTYWNILRCNRFYDRNLESNRWILSSFLVITIKSLCLIYTSRVNRPQTISNICKFHFIEVCPKKDEWSKTKLNAIK